MPPPPARSVSPLARVLTWAATSGFAASATVHVLSLTGAARYLGGAAPALFFGLAVSVPAWMVLWAAHARRNGVGTWDKPAQNRLVADVLDAVPRRRELALWAALAYGLLWFVLLPVVGSPTASLSAFLAFGYLFVATVSPQLAEAAEPPFSRKRYDSPL